MIYGNRKPRKRSKIKEDAIKILSEKACIITEFARQLKVNYTMAAKIIEELDQDGILEKWHAPSFKHNQLCMHYKVRIND